MTQNKISNIVNIEKYKNGIDLWGNFSVVLADELYFTFFISYYIPFLLEFGAAEALAQSVLEMDKHAGDFPPPSNSA